MQCSSSKVHRVGAECNYHALVLCTVSENLLTYCKGQVVGDRPGELKLKKKEPKQLSRIQPKVNVIKPNSRGSKITQKLYGRQVQHYGADDRCTSHNSWTAHA